MEKVESPYHSPAIGFKREDGKVFAGHRTCPSTGSSLPTWYSAERYAYRLESSLRRKANYFIKNYAKLLAACDTSDDVAALESAKRRAIAAVPVRRVRTAEEVAQAAKARANSTAAIARRSTPEYKAKRKAWRNRPENRAKHNAYNVAYLKKRYGTDPAFNAQTRVKAHIKHAVNRFIVAKSSATSEVKASGAAAFLVWLLARNHRGAAKGLDIDHLIPVSKWSPTSYGLNSPENLRWLEATENRHVKRDRMPSEQEVAAHLDLVSKWRNSQPRV